ncbi:uncharacterized protein LOC127737764 [Mytilus californianus]|uniref:uncharacterized protein LOC127737764 n=1 Tax=Mytilus californianus TaxID=6549 RepID=UPI002247CB31|nr:uncharacterized protein LOC127737764 [Mytilus californianus]
MVQIFILTYLTYEILSGFHTYYVEGFIVMDCYWVDDNNGMAAFQNFISSDSTTVSCLEKCTDWNYNYAATKFDVWGTFECFCGNDIQFTTTSTGSDCAFPCPISVTDRCGRKNRIAVYDIRGESLPINIPVVEPTTEVSTSTVERLTTTTAVNTMTSIDEHKTTVSIGNEKTSTASPLVQSTEISTHVAELPVSTSARSSIKETMSTQITESSSSISTTAVEMVSSSSNYNNPSTSYQMPCMCPCSSVSTKWNFLANMNMSIAELKIFLNDYLDELKRNLTIDKTTTSAYLNTKISAPDDRKSSVSIGYFGLFLVGIPLVFIVCSDAMRFVMQFQKR